MLYRETVADYRESHGTHKEFMGRNLSSVELSEVSHVTPYGRSVGLGVDTLLGLMTDTESVRTDAMGGSRGGNKIEGHCVPVCRVLPLRWFESRSLGRPFLAQLLHRWRYENM